MTKTYAGALLGTLLTATALTPAVAADMTHERALNVAKEPQNWLLPPWQLRGPPVFGAQGNQH